MNFRSSLAALCLGIVATMAAVSANAQAADQVVGDAERGRVLAYTCHGCHGVASYRNAYPNYSVPKLGGQHAAYIASALRAYASGERPHQTMHSHAATMSDQDRADIAAFLEGPGVQSRPEVVGTPPPATQTCVACHGADGAKTVTPEYPILAGQHADYLVYALQAYKSGQRTNPIMAGIVSAVDEKDFEAIARFFAQQPGLCGTEQIRDHGKCGHE